MSESGYVALISALLGAGALPMLARWSKRLGARWRSTRPEARARQDQADVRREVHEHVASADASLAVVAHSRDELREDNTALRAQIAETEARHARERAEIERRHDRDRAQWERERTQMRHEIDALEEKVRSLLEELLALKDRHALPERPAPA